MAEKFRGAASLAAARLRRSSWILVGTVVALLAVATWLGMRRAASMAAALMPAGDAHAAPGAAVKWVLEIVAVDADGTLHAIQLDRISDARYARSARSVVVHDNARTRVMMGAAGDLRPAAIVYVAGTPRGDREADAGRIVILTGYVHVGEAAEP